MNKEELRLTMIIDTFRDKLIELDEQEFINWATTLFNLQKRLDRANNIISIYENYLDKLLKGGETLCNQIDEIEGDINA